MRRALLAVVATVVTVVGLLHYKTSSAPSQFRIAVSGSPPATPPVPAPSPSPSSAPPAAAPPSPSPPSSPPRTRTVTGPAVDNRYGPVQVAVTVAGGKISDIQTLELPSDRARSAYISSVAGPILRQEALQTQSAQIDTVSGATYTSDSFAQSLQAALTQAGF